MLFRSVSQSRDVGLNEWLSQQQGSVSKADIQKFLKENRVQIAEVVKGGFDDGEVASWWNDEGGANEEKPFDELTGRVVLILPVVILW